MPVEFLTDEEAASYGRDNGSPSRADLERAFFLDDADKVVIARRRGDHNRLGFSMQMTTARSLGLFLADPLDVPTWSYGATARWNCERPSLPATAASRSQ